MAVRAAVIDNGKAATKGDFSIQRVMWNGLLNGDTGAPVALSEWSDRVIQVGALNVITGVASVFGAGGSVTLQGSNDYQPFATDDGNPANAGTWMTLTCVNPATSLSGILTPGVLAQITEDCLWVRPIVTAGDGTTNLAVVMSARRVQSMMRGG